MAACVADIGQQQDDAEGNDRKGYPGCDDFLAKQFDAAGKQYQAQSKQQKTGGIETPARGGEIRHIFARVKYPDNADRNINEENPVPAGPGNQHAAEHRPKNRANKAGHSDEVQYGEQFAARVGS